MMLVKVNLITMVNLVPFDNPVISVSFNENLILPKTYLHAFLKYSNPTRGEYMIGINHSGLVIIRDFLETGSVPNPYDIQNRRQLIIQGVNGTFENLMDYLGYDNFTYVEDITDDPIEMESIYDDYTEYDSDIYMDQSDDDISDDP